MDGSFFPRLKPGASYNENHVSNTLQLYILIIRHDIYRVRHLSDVVFNSKDINRFHPKHKLHS